MPEAENTVTDDRRSFEYRLSSSIAIGGVFLILVAMVLWLTAGNGPIVPSLHHLAAISLGAIGAVLLGTGLVIAPPSTREDPTE